MDGHTRVDDLTDSMVAGHHHPLPVGGVGLYGMGVQVSNDHMAHALDVERRAGPQMTTPGRQGLGKKRQR